MTAVFSSENYRKYLKLWLDSHSNGRGMLTRFATAISCQNSHLTRLFRSEVHLTPDQAYAASIFMNFSEVETRYFMKLVEFERAGTPVYRQRLKTEIEALRSEQENLAQRFQQTQLGDLEKEMTYYSSWIWSAIHILTDIPRYQNAAAIASRLRLDERSVRHCLQMLEKFDLVKQFPGERWKISSKPIHLPKNSPMTAVQHSNWRTQGAQRSQDLNADGLHFTVVQTVSEEDYHRIKQILLEAIDQYRKVANPSPAEELVCLTCDFFRP